MGEDASPESNTEVQTSTKAIRIVNQVYEEIRYILKQYFDMVFSKPDPCYTV